jgi:hypothetical protein
VWHKKFCSWLEELSGSTANPAESDKVVNQSKEKRKDADVLKKRKLKQAFLNFSSASAIGAAAKEVFEQANDVPLPKITSILLTADRALKRAKLEEGKVAETRVRLQKEDQLKVLKYQLGNKFSYNRTKQEFPSWPLNETTVSGWKTKYLGMVKAYEKEGKTHEEAELLATEEYTTGVKQGRPTLLPTAEHQLLLKLLKAIRDAQGKVTPLIVVAVGNATMIDAGKGEQLSENGGPLELSLAWARGILSNALGWTRRKATTDRKMTAEELQNAALEAQALEEQIAQYHPELVYEMDETLAPWCPTDDSTWAEEGCSRIGIQGQNDKRGNTATLTIKRSNKLLPLQTIWDGLTDRSLPRFKWPVGHLACFAGVTSETIREDGSKKKKSNKWQNRKTMQEYVKGILQPDIERVRKTLSPEELDHYPKKDRALFISDYHWSHEGDWVNPLLKDLRVDHGRVAKKATDWFSVLDLQINKPFKGHLKNRFGKHCTTQILSQLKQGIKPENVKLDVRASVVKHLAAQWIFEAWSQIKNKEEEIIKSGWELVKKNIAAKL